MKDSDLTGDSSLARAFESKHGHLQLRGNKGSSIEEPGQATPLLSYPIFSSKCIVNSKVPYSDCQAEEEGERMGTTPPATRIFDPEGVENETRIYVHYLWSGVTILNLLFPISPLTFFLFLA
ncbi:hypothetical protein KIW84_012948 [Lathyrus oleraceus]|uniref:Uncharacterized protein n=1 Tax=Pisum sativum TaxID=3888 RepID=A0A9D5BIV3_PEA|nr:hypothetical protein KIW84_012948 [Pisum sativum]